MIKLNKLENNNHRGKREVWMEKPQSLFIKQPRAMLLPLGYRPTCCSTWTELPLLTTSPVYCGQLLPLGSLSASRLGPSFGWATLI